MFQLTLKGALVKQEDMEGREDRVRDGFQLALNGVVRHVWEGREGCVCDGVLVEVERCGAVLRVWEGRDGGFSRWCSI